FGVSNDMSDDYWKNFNPHEEWKIWDVKKTNPSNDRHGNIRSYELIITKEDDDWIMDYLFSNDSAAFMRESYEEVVTKKCKIDERPGDVARKLYDEFDGISKTNGWLEMA
nr:hypothetical protein [Tanacetum cinerariifolium]